MAYDPATGEWSSSAASNGSFLNDTWTWNGTTWTERSPATSPPARYFASMAYDPATGNMVLFGGDGSSGYLGDTWTWNGITWTERPPAPPLRPASSPPWPTTRPPGTWSSSAATAAPGTR